MKLNRFDDRTVIHESRVIHIIKRNEVISRGVTSRGGMKEMNEPEANLVPSDRSIRDGYTVSVAANVN